MLYVHLAVLQIHYFSPACPVLLVKHATEHDGDVVLVCMHTHAVMGLDLRGCGCCKVAQCQDLGQ